jgi:hypothetical protein
MVFFLAINAYDTITNLCFVLIIIIRSSKDEDCQQALLSLIEKVPINDSVHHVVTKILSTCVKLSEKVGDSTSSMSGMHCDISENSRMREI